VSLEVVRCLADWFAHATYGINARLPNVPRLSGVSAAPAVTILDEQQHAVAALGQIPDTGLPAVLIASGDLDQLTPVIRPSPPDGTLEVMARYVARDDDAVKVGRDSDLTMRAAKWSAYRLFDQPAGEAARQALATAVQVQLLNLVSARVVAIADRPDSNLSTRGLLLTMRVRDLHASTP
jgi:hypothetical protein